MNKLALCVPRTVIKRYLHPRRLIQGCYMYPLDVSSIPSYEFHFLNRSLADSDRTDYQKIAEKLPQVLPYILVMCGDQYLTYSRQKGAEARLHGKLSCGFGGHVDIQDIKNNAVNLYDSALRELTEELNVNMKSSFLSNEKKILVDSTDEVGMVHLGVVYLLEVTYKEDVSPDPAEISSPEWQTLEQLKSNIDQYENWSKTLISEYIGTL